MATRSTIALEFADGTVGQVYCHWDGYLEHNGAVLTAHYMDPFKVRELIDLGDLSSLAPEIGVKHEFGNPHPYKSAEYEAWNAEYARMCTFYGRDRNETGIAARYFKDFVDYSENAQFEEYDYILRRDGHWYVNSHNNNGYVCVVDALQREAA